MHQSPTIKTRLTSLGMLWLASTWTLAAHATPDFSGVWHIEERVDALRPSDHSALPLTAQGKAQFAKNQALLRKNQNSFDLTASRCASPGAVRLMTLPYDIEFFQRPYQLTALFEWNHLYRLINLSDKRHEAPYPLAIGISNGHWEGNVLVVETTSLTDNTLLDSSGLPHSDQLQVVEKFQLVDGDHLQDTMTIHDPQTFSHDWSVTLTYKKTAAKGIREDICLDRVEAGKPAIAESR